MSKEATVAKNAAKKASTKVVDLFDKKNQRSPSAVAIINVYEDKYASVRTANHKQLAHLNMSKDDSGKEKLETLFSTLDKLCIRDANYWVTLPTGSRVRKNTILGFECVNSKHSGVILRGHNDQIVTFIPCSTEEGQTRIINEIKQAIEETAPSRRYHPTWDFYQDLAA
ncbi:hypothetical protein [Vibrio splendidus]|uniref:hypothetical protein n=1 Tax=Vibrio splendidus TaxID=29497 RepID=UPI000D394E40|nr:hypothetical protein [Vibrio splendidus]PTP27536.1 hypothetical protein CWN95_23605 [Vibrio splendidus]